MQARSHHPQSLLAATVIVFLLVFSFNAYACVLPLSGTSDVSMANGCSTPSEPSARQLCDAFKILGVESNAQSAWLLVDHHWLADHAPASLPVVSRQSGRIRSSDQPFESSSPPHPSLACTVLRI